MKLYKLIGISLSFYNVIQCMDFEHQNNHLESISKIRINVYAPINDHLVGGLTKNNDDKMNDDTQQIYVVTTIVAEAKTNDVMVLNLKNK